MAASAEIVHTVTDADTASALGSGDLAVLATPRLLAWCEEATCAALDLPAERTSVGTRVDLEHLAASPVGATVRARAEVVHEDGRLLRFRVTAHDVERDTLLASGEVRRVVVDRERFLSRLP
ncbi:MAG: thioesterase [Aeromicrobium erythreum]